jgi:hypothetical protein
MGKIAKTLKRQTFRILSYCSIPQDIASENSALNEASCDVYVAYKVTPKDEQGNFDDDFALDNWIIEHYPDCEGEEILIHMDY